MKIAQKRQFFFGMKNIFSLDMKTFSSFFFLSILKSCFLMPPNVVGKRPNKSLAPRVLFRTKQPQNIAQSAIYRRIWQHCSGRVSNGFESVPISTIVDLYVFIGKTNINDLFSFFS